MRRNSFYVMANLLSLGVAFALMIIGYFNYEFNHSFNHFFSDAENIYRISSVRQGFADDAGMGITPLPLRETIESSMGDSRVARYQASSVIVRKGEALLSKQAAYVDQAFLDMFDFSTSSGDRLQLRDKSQVILATETAQALYGRTDLEGEMLVLQQATGKKAYEVRAVLAEFPENISFRFDLIFLFDDYLDSPGVVEQDWSHWIDATFVQLPQNELAAKELQEVLNSNLDLQNEHNKGREVASYRLDNLLDWPTNENQLYQSSFMGVLHPASVLGTISSAVFVMLLACFNFINISISLSGQRLKEIAMRKVLGGSKQSIIRQFLLENLILVAVSVGLALGVAYWLIPAYNALFDYNIVQFQFVDWQPFLVFSTILFITVILMAGGYPAWYVSRYHSLQIFREKVRLGGSGKLLGFLIGLQFIVCFYNVFSLLIFVENAEYQNTLDRGYQVDNVLNVPVKDQAQLDLMKNELAQVPTITSIGETNQLIGFHTLSRVVRFEGEDMGVEVLAVGDNYLETVKVRLVRGRMFRDSETDRQHVIVNEMMEQKLGGDVLGRNIQLRERVVKVIGVVEDFNLKNILLDNEIKPTLIKVAAPDQIRFLSVMGEITSGQVLKAQVEEVWYRLFPDELYAGFLQERVTRPLQQTNRIVISINSFVALVAIFISVLGLYSTISISINRRIKELGIRKVLGATAWQIAYSLNHRMVLILIVASIFGLTGGYFFISNLLDIIYAYHINIDVKHFVFPIILIALIIVGSVGWKVGKSVRENPVKQLRAE